MTAHVLVPALDEERPATLSPRDRRRTCCKRELGYRGLVLSDDLEMKAISGRYGVPEATVAAIAAGCDAVLMCGAVAGAAGRRRSKRVITRRRRRARCRSSASRMRWRGSAGSRSASWRRRTPLPLARRGAARRARPRRAPGRGRRDGEVRAESHAQAARARGRAIASRVVAPASPFARDEFDAGVAELRRLGFEPVYDDSRVRPAAATSPGAAQLRAGALRATPGDDPAIAAVVAVRGGYGSVQLLPLLDRGGVGRHAEGLRRLQRHHVVLTLARRRTCGLVSFHGPMIEGRLAQGQAGYDRDTFRALPLPRRTAGRDRASARSRSLKPGEARGMLVGGTLTQLAASLGTPYAFDPPAGLRPVPRRSRRAAVPARSDADAAAAERACSSAPSAHRVRRAAACDEPGGESDARATSSRDCTARLSRARCCSACRRATPRARR